MQILAYNDPHRPEVHGRCLVHPHVFGRRLGVIFYEVADNQRPSIAQAAEAVATSYLRLIPGRDPDEVLWLQAWPPETSSSGTRVVFPAVEVTYRWPYGRARCPMWHTVESAIAETVRRLWYHHNGPALAATVVHPAGFTVSAGAACPRGSAAVPGEGDAPTPLDNGRA